MKEVGGKVKHAFPSCTVISIKQFRRGCVNKTYSVDIINPKKELVLRFYPTEFWKAEKEEYVYNLIRKKTSVPVPKIYHIDASRKYSPYAFSILKKIPGRKLTTGNKMLISKSGEYLAQINSINFSKFGWIVGKKINPGFTKWVNFCDYDFDNKIKNLQRYKRLGLKILSSIKEYYQKNRHLLDIKVKPCLVHKDFHLSHILTSNNKITGIIDVEWAISGHNELDITKSLYWMFENRIDLEEVFLDGYLKFKRISKDFQLRRELYELLICLSSVLFSCRVQDDKWYVHNVKKLKGILRK
ncbi:MAG: aminoglycoside phosphotransferase family protein [Nanoarchaeota archaeon]